MTQDHQNDWVQIRIRTDSKLSDTVSDLLEQLGALAVTFEDAADNPILEPRPGERRLWPNTDVIGLFAQGTDPSAVVNKLQAILGDPGNSGVKARSRACLRCRHRPSGD